MFDPSMARCVVTMRRVDDAIAAQAATHETCRPDLGDRRLWVRFSSDPDATDGEPESAAKQEETWCAATRDSATLGVPGLTLIEDFVTEEEEREMLKCVDSDERWQRLAKRRGAPLRVRVRLRDQRRERRNVADARVRRAVTSQGVGMRRAGCFGERDVRSAHGERVRARRGDRAARTRTARLGPRFCRCRSRGGR